MRNQKATRNRRTNRNIPRLDRVAVRGGIVPQMRLTIKLIGDAIVDSSRYLPIRNRAAALATTASPKDYLGQVKAVYGGFLRHWRYVRDPFGRELVHRSPKQVFELVMGGSSDSPGVGLGRGAGDCDDATIAIGAQLASIGFPVRIATIAPEGMPSGPTMSHVFAQANIPGLGWVTVDPVVHPAHGFGYTPPHSRLVTWDLTGQLLGQSGNVQDLDGYQGENMYTDVDRWQDYSGLGDYLGDNEPLYDFREHGVKDFGIYADEMGMLGGCGLMAEVDTDEYGRAWTPQLELAPHDWNFVRQNGAAYHGMLGLSDEAEPYIYDEGLGFFRRLFKRIRKGIRKVGKKVWGGIKRVGKRLKKFGKKLLRKIPGGKFLLKLGKKIWKVATKFVRPLAKFIGKAAKKLAPIAALIPGYGPAISAAMYKTGKIADLMNKFNVKSVAKKAGISRLRFPSGKTAKRFQKALKKLARKTKRRRQRVKSKRRSAISRGIAPIRSRARRVSRVRRARPSRRLSTRSYRRLRA